MNALETCQRIRACFDALFRSNHVKYLEAENARLRVKNESLELAARERNEPRPLPASALNGPASVNPIRNSKAILARTHKRIFIEPAAPSEKPSEAEAHAQA